MAAITTNRFYAYDGSVASLSSGLLDVSLLNGAASVGTATLTDPNGFLSQADDAGASFTLGGMTGAVEFLGTGTISTLSLLGIKLDPRPVAAFVVDGQIYLYAPQGLPLLSGVAVSFDINPNGTLTFPISPDGQVDGLDSGEQMLLGYTDKQGDRITTGNDVINAFGGNDTVDGDRGNDTISGGDGNDSLRGGAGADRISGDAGNDTLSGGAGNDTLTGGIGADRFIVDGTADLITDFNATQSIQGGQAPNQTDNDFVDLSQFYSAQRLADYNAANPGATFANPLAWLKADQRDDGILQAAGGLRVQSAADVALGANLLSFENTNVICFSRGTQIETANGEVAIEDLAVGDLIRTVDHGYQPIRWIGSTRVSATGKLAPIHFDAGVLGNRRALGVSPQHRMLLSGWQAEILFGEQEVLVPAKMLVNDTTIRRVVGGMAEYWHMLFDTHEIIFAEGALSESFHPGDVGMSALSEASRDEVLTLFPELASGNLESYGPSARQSIHAKEAKILAELIADGTFLVNDYGPLARIAY